MSWTNESAAWRSPVVARTVMVPSSQLAREDLMVAGSVLHSVTPRPVQELKAAVVVGELLTLSTILTILTIVTIVTIVSILFNIILRQLVRRLSLDCSLRGRCC